MSNCFYILLFLSGSCRMGTVHDAKPRFAIRCGKSGQNNFFLLISSTYQHNCVSKFNLQTSKEPHTVSKLTTLSCKARVFQKTKRWEFVRLAPIRWLPDGARTIIYYQFSTHTSVFAPLRQDKSLRVKSC